MPTVIPTTAKQPSVNVAKSNLGRSGLTRSDSYKPASKNTANIGLMEWRKENTYPYDPNWR